MNEELREIIIKYGNGKEFSNFNLHQNIPKVSEQITSICNKYGISVFDRIIMLESLAQTSFKILIDGLKGLKGKEELMYYCLYKNQEIDRNVLLRTQLGKLIDVNLNSKPKMDLGSSLNIGIKLSERFDVLQKTNFSCKYCGRKPPEVELELEHIIPKSKGGKDSVDNLVPACRDCNRGKGVKRLNEEVEGEKEG